MAHVTKTIAYTLCCLLPVQAATLLPLPLPSAAGPAAAAQIKEPSALMRAIQASVVASVAGVWRHEKLPSAAPALMAQVCVCGGGGGG